jgi:alpha-galactosidase
MIKWLSVLLVLDVAAALAIAQNLPAGTQKIENTALAVTANAADGSYAIRSRENMPASLGARIGAKVDGHWIYSTGYPRHHIEESSFHNDLGEGSQLTVTNAGLPNEPDLVCVLRLYTDPSFAEIEVQLQNGTQKQITVQAIRLLEAAGEPRVNLAAPDSADRVLSDSFSEDRPAMAIHDLLAAEDGMHRGVGSQLIYNRQSKQSLFVGALSSERWLTVLRLHVDAQSRKISGYEVDSTGTTELAKENSLRESPPQDQMELSLPVAPGASLSAEPVMIALGADYHAQLELYGNLIRKLHHPRVTAATPMGWWSWTAFYFGLTEGTALTNAEFLAQELKPFGYTFFHIDEGYQYARGEYTTPDATKFPHGVGALENHVRAMGLTPGIWTAPFEVSQRSWLFQNHPDWLIHNAQGQPIHAGYVIDDPDAKQQLDPLYILDSTNPGAQQYLHTTYSTLAKDWGIRYIKLDFMDDSAIEGNYYRPNTSALQAQRIGLRIIRDAVGEHVLLDKDGSPMLNPVGIVDAGRISQDTGHTFEASHDAATGIAARYYMNRNFFLSDPDAFSVSEQTVDEQEWHGGKTPLTLDEAQVSIALSAVSGGMFEIGDDLPTLYRNQDRMALVENRDLINMARYGHASTPLDLMDYAPEDSLPSIFLLRESKRTAILTVFNWTDHERDHEIRFSAIGLQAGGHNRVSDIFNPAHSLASNAEQMILRLPPRCVRMFKIEDTSIPKTEPSITAAVPAEAETGKSVPVTASANPDGAPVLSYSWDFGDGTSAQGAAVTHAYTHAGDFTLRLSAEDIEGMRSEREFRVSVKGKIETRFHPSQIQRPPTQP